MARNYTFSLLLKVPSNTKLLNVRYFLLYAFAKKDDLSKQ